jgi:pimeloyl-ACP methyl ester carboxylesterase
MANAMNGISSTEPTPLKEVQLDGLIIAYREIGSGPPVLLLHGWPTSSFLWREVMLPIGRRNRVLAPDLPGFGASDKPLGIRYGFEFFARTIDQFLAAAGVDQLSIGVHDLGGPIGLHWALQHPERMTKLALLNTLVYPELSAAALEFVRLCSTPGLREQLTSADGLGSVMRLGLANEDKLSDEVLAAVTEPFSSRDARRALAQAGIGLEPEGFVEIARRLPSLDIPIRIVYGERDRILPDVADTMARVARDLPQAVVTALPAGHFLQEEAPEVVGELLASFFGD